MELKLTTRGEKLCYALYLKKKKKGTLHHLFFFWIIFNFINQTGAGYKWDQSTSQADLRTSGRLSLLQLIKDLDDKGEILAALWATALQSLLTQQKKRLRNRSLRLKVLLMILLMVYTTYLMHYVYEK